jgi:hypothetical protein
VSAAPPILTDGSLALSERKAVGARGWLRHQGQHGRARHVDQLDQETLNAFYIGSAPPIVLGRRGPSPFWKARFGPCRSSD